MRRSSSGFRPSSTASHEQRRAKRRESIIGGWHVGIPLLQKVYVGSYIFRQHVTGRKRYQYKPNPFFVWSVHLDGSQEEHDHSVCQAGVYDRAVSAIRAAKARGFRVNINCTLFNNADPERVATFFDEVRALGVDAMTISPGYAYERAPDQEHFLHRETTKQLFRDIFRRGENG